MYIYLNVWKQMANVRLLLLNKNTLWFVKNIFN